MSGRNRSRAFLGLGGNIGEPAKAMAAALRALDANEHVAVLRVSSIYRTPAWGVRDQPDFLNAAAEIDTTLSAHELLDLCLATESALKRERRERWGPRVIDIDLLLYGEERINEEGLQIPHPRMLERAFVLVPLAEIAPELRLEGRAVSDQLAPLDASWIERVHAGGGWWKTQDPLGGGSQTGSNPA